MTGEAAVVGEGEAATADTVTSHGQAVNVSTVTL